VASTKHVTPASAAIGINAGRTVDIVVRTSVTRMAPKLLASR
jgi:hypothetical protein